MQRSLCKSSQMSSLLQSFIYTMNNKKLRSEIIQYHLRFNHKKETHDWLGTWMVSLAGNNNLESIENIAQLQAQDKALYKLIAKNKKRFTHKIALFTVCIVYDRNLVHYVSFVYIPSEKKLWSFDPGVELYLHGQKTIVPQIRRAFHQNGLISNTQIHPQQDLGRCTDNSFCGKKWGIQYNGNHKTHLPADSFCQTWTIYFSIRLLLQEDSRDLSFVEDWCRISPKERESSIITYFILPQLLLFKNMRNEYLYQIQNMLESSMTMTEVMRNLYQYIEKCAPKIQNRRPPIIHCHS